MMEQLEKTAGLLDERTITIGATTSRLNYYKTNFANSA